MILDFVVGAPYEDDSGCIYVYNGGRHLPVHYSQVIPYFSFFKLFNLSFNTICDIDVVI